MLRSISTGDAYGATGSHHSGSHCDGRKTCIRGMRVTVGMIVGQIGAGHTIEELFADYPICSVKTFFKH